MAFCPSSVLTTSLDTPYLMRVYNERKNKTIIQTPVVREPQIFTIWEIMFFVWLLLTPIAIGFLFK